MRTKLPSTPKNHDNKISNVSKLFEAMTFTEINEITRKRLTDGKYNWDTI